MSIDQKVFEEFLKKQKEPEQLTKARRAAFLLAQTLPMPVSRFSRNRFRTDFSKLDAAALTMSDHATRIESGDTKDVEQLAFSDVWKDISLFVGQSKNKIEALRAAFAVNGGSLFVRDHALVKDPIVVSCSIKEKSSSSSPVTFIRLGKNASARVIYDLETVEDSALISNLLFVELEDGADLELVTITRGKGKAWQYGKEEVKLGVKSRLKWIDLAEGKGIREVTKRAVLDGDGSEGFFYGMFGLKDGDHLDFSGGLVHRGTHTLGDVLVKGTLEKGSEIVFEGVLKVEKDAQKTESSLYDHTLVLSPGVKMDSVPGLEIEANDVRVRHGASASPVNEEQIFYLESRGFSRPEARTLIIEGFTKQIFDQLSIATKPAVLKILSHESK